MFKGLSSPSFSPFRRTSSSKLNVAISEALDSPINSPTTSNSPSPPLFDTLALAKQDLLTSLEALQSISRRAYSHKFALLAQIQHILEEEEESRSTFIEYGGYLLILSVLSSLEEGVVGEIELAEGEDTYEVRNELRYELVKLVFLILEVNMRGNEKHRIAFQETVGYTSLAEAIHLSTLMSNTSESQTNNNSRGTSAEKLLSILHSFLVADFSSPPIYTSLRLQLEDSEGLDPKEPEKVIQSEIESTSSISSSNSTLFSKPFPSSRVLKLLEERTSIIENVGIVVAMLGLVQDLEGQLPSFVVSSILSLSITSRRSQIALSEVGIIKIAMNKLYRSKDLVEGDEREIWKSLLASQMELGAGSIELKELFQILVKGKGRESEAEVMNGEILDLLHLSSITSQRPSFFNFDFSSHGHSSISLPSLGKAFPPTTLGYSFLGWISIIEPPSVFDGKLIIFSVYDVSYKCFVEISLDSNLRLAIVTSINKPPVIFESTTLSLNHFYHIAIVHQRSTFSSASSVLLYLDGNLVETVKQVYPATSPKDWEVSASIGTPFERIESGRFGKGKSRMRWECGTTWLIHGDLTEEAIRLCCSLGPRYVSNFQDSLGQFLNKSQSTLDFIRTESLSLSQSIKQSRAGAVSIASKPGALISENRIYFTFSPCNILDSSSSTALAIASKSKLLTNSSISTSDHTASSIGYLLGEPSIARINSLDVEIFKIGGMTVLLKLVELATNSSQLTKAVKIFVSIIVDNFRNSEEADKTRAYELLGHLLMKKVEVLTSECCESLFLLVGFNFDQPSKSVVANIEACRYLLLDFSIWSLADKSIQGAHLDRLKAFVEVSEFSMYNGKRLAKLHLTRKLLYALRTEVFESTVIPQGINLLLYVASQYFTTETIRHIATYLTATCTTPSSSPPVTSTTYTSFILDASVVGSNGSQSGSKVLLGFHNYLLNPKNAADLVKFSKTITIKWLLSLILDAEPFNSILALRILVKILQQGETSATKFVNEGGPYLLRVVISRLWNYSQFSIAILALLYSHDISLLPLDTPFNHTTFLDESLITSEITPAILRILIDSIAEGLKHSTLNSSETDQEKTPINLDSCLSLVEGFDILVELVFRAIRTGGITYISSTSLSNLTNTLGLFLRPTLISTNFTPTSNLPIISLANGYNLPFSNPVEESPSSSLESVQLGFESYSLTSSSALQTIVSNFFCNIALHRLTFRHRLKNSEDEESCMKALEDIFDSSAALELSNQVTFRTSVIQECLIVLSEYSVNPSSSTRIALFVTLAVDLTLEGWNRDLNSLLEFTLTFVEKILQDSPLSSNNFQVQTVDSLFRSINRLSLFALSGTDSLKILLRHQLSIFASENTNADYFRCLIQRLYSLLSGTKNLENQEVISLVDLFKLVLLQRPAEAEAALTFTEDSDLRLRLSERLLDTDTEKFVEILLEYKERLEILEGIWQDVLNYETRRARKQVNREMSRLNEISQRFSKSSVSRDQKVRLYRTKISEWMEGIHDVESTRSKNSRQDNVDQKISVSQGWVEQAASIYLPGAILASSNSIPLTWEIDSVEGPHRIRKKVHPEIVASHLFGPNHSPEIKLSSLGRPSVASLEILTPIVENDEMNSIDSGEIDQNRRVRRLLQPRDVILHVFNSNRIIGLDSCQSLVILTAKNFYLVDNYFQRTNGELVTVWEVPDSERDQHLLTLSELSGHAFKPVLVEGVIRQSRHWSWSDLVEVYQRKYLFQSTALELFFADGSSHLLVFASTADRSTVYELLAQFNPQAVSLGALTLAGSSLGGKLQDVIRGQRTRLEITTKRWESKEISNFEYIMFLNTQAGRTYNDLTNYPIFPWIIAEYESEVLDLTNPATFRDLSLPMGAQTEARRKEARERYDQLAELGDGTIPFHYGTHYSSAAAVVGFMVRCQPFTKAYLDIQKSFDHPDRMFWSIGRARTDVRELIPEFFYLPEFLSNHNNLKFESRQENKTPIDNVELPKWSKSPSDFISQHRNALECDFVSSKLHLWIDLIFGFKSTGVEAIKALNMFHSLSYENAIDLDDLSERDRRSAIATIHNFGLCPPTLFAKPHPPQRTNSGFSKLLAPKLSIEEKVSSLVQSFILVRRISGPVLYIYPSSSAYEKTVATSTLSVPGDSEYTVSWKDYNDKSLRIQYRGVTVSILENLHEGQITCGTFADSRLLITGSDDTTISIWNWSLLDKEVNLEPIACLRGHKSSISSLASSKAFSVIVSSSQTEVFVWDLNRHRLVHRLEGHDASVSMTAVSNNSGNIATVSGTMLRIYSINGNLLSQRSTANYLDPITSISFSSSERESLIATGHSKGVVNIWKLVADSSTTLDWRLELLRKLQQTVGDSSLESSSSITSLVFTSNTLYTGNKVGEVNVWT